MLEFLKKLFSPVTRTIAFIQNHFKAMIFLLILFLIFAPGEEESFKPNNLQMITLKGPIFDATETVEELDTARKNSHIKGVLIDIDSPGGAVAPSIEIAYAIKRLQAAKPVVVYSSGLLASGGYYAAIWADEIIANPGAMVGSIGVIIQGADLSELMNKVGIKTQVVKAGKYKQVGTADREWTPYERNELTKVVQGTYSMFVDDVATARGLDPKKSVHYANAHIFTAAQAQEAGLVDTLAVGYDAKKRVETLSGVDNAIWNKEDKFEKFFRQLGAEGSLLLHTWFPSISLR